MDKDYMCELYRWEKSQNVSLTQLKKVKFAFEHQKMICPDGKNTNSLAERSPIVSMYDERNC